MANYMKARNLVPEASSHAYEEKGLRYPDVKSIIEDLSDEVAYLARRNTPMWLDSGLNLDEYKKKYNINFAGLDQFTSLSSRVLNAKLPVSIQELTADLNNPEMLVNMFPSILGYATSSRCTGSDYLVLDVDYEVSPLLRSGEKRLVRYNKEVIGGTLVIADFSARERSTSPPADFIKFPSGFVVRANEENCTVSIVDHWMIKNTPTSPILASINGAHRLFTSLQRHYIFRYATSHMFQNKDYRDRAKLLSTRLLHVFSHGITGVRSINDYVTERGWIKDEASDESVRVFKKDLVNGEWRSAVGSVRVEATSSMVSSLLQGPSDIWKNLPAFEMGELQFQMWRGQEHPTKNIENICFSIYQIKRQGKSDGFLIEETSLDEPKLVVRAILDGPIYESLVRKDGISPSKVDLLPYGIVIHPDPASQGCIVTMGYQFKTDQFKDIEEARTMITSTLSSLANVGANLSEK